MATLGLKSLLQLDHNLRFPFVRKLLGSSRSIVTSDWSITRILKGFVLKPLRELGFWIYKNLKSEGYVGIKLPNSEKKWIVGIVDATGIGNILASVVQVLGRTNVLLDMKVMKGKGYELPTSFKLLKGVKKQFGRKGFLDLLMGDGLYACSNFFNICINELGCDALVKTTETTLNIISDAEGIFANADKFKETGVETAERIDLERMLKYKIYACGEFEFEGVKKKLKVAKVEETILKGKRAGETEIFYILTTANYLTPEQMRELGHLRWRIENKGFKALNEQCHSKHIFTHNKKASEMLMRIMHITFNLLQAYKLKIENEKLEWKKLIKQGRITFGFFRELFTMSLGMPELNSG